MSEKSGIDILKELLDKVNLLDRRFAVIEQNTKELLNRANLEATKPKIMVNNEMPTIKSSIPEPTVAPATEPPKKRLDTKIIGKIKNREGKSLIGASVKVYNDKKQLVKDTRTNRAGDWMCFLPPGTYAANYFLEGQISANAVFTVTKGEKIVRVAQPQL